MSGDADPQGRRNAGFSVSQIGSGRHQAVRAALRTGPAAVSAELDG
jgi:hypothetical protein